MCVLLATGWPLRGAAALPHRTLWVGAGRQFERIADAARVARPQDVIEVDAGDYHGDVAVWTQDDVTLRARGGPVRLIAQGTHAEGKGIWVVRARGMHAEGFEFIGARVPDRNGARIRLDAGSLTLRECVFRDNENGILTGNRPDTQLSVENCEFDGNGAGDGQTHNLYAGSIGQLEVCGSYFHRALVGHLIKSRARENRILYNRLTDEAGGRASYELEFPSGGDALVIGNLIQQASTTENSTLVSFGAENFAWPVSVLRMSHNTLVDDRPEGGRFVAVRAGAKSVILVNNVFAGPGAVDTGGPADQAGNLSVRRERLVERESGMYRLPKALVEGPGAVDPVRLGWPELRPVAEYVHPRRWRELDAAGVLQTGALQSGY